MSSEYINTWVNEFGDRIIKCDSYSVKVRATYVLSMKLEFCSQSPRTFCGLNHAKGCANEYRGIKSKWETKHE